MRIGITTTTLEPALNGGILDGIGIYTRALMSRLPAQGITPLGLSYPTMRIPGTHLEAPAMPRPYPQQLIASMLGLSVQPPQLSDLVHVTDYRCVRMRCPVVATLHDAIPLRFPQWTSMRLRRLKNVLMKQAARYADKVIAVSHAAVPELVEYFQITEDRIAVVPNGVDQDWLDPVSPAAVAELLQARGLRTGYFLFVGTFQPRKNIRRLVRAYRSLPLAVRQQRQLLLVGKAGWRCEDDLAEIHRAREQSENVVWLNDLEGHDALRLTYAGAGAFIFPSLHEGYGIPVLEAFGSGIPVACSNTSSLPEVAGGAAIEFDPTDEDAMAYAMLQAVANTDDNLKRVTLGRQRAAALSWDNTARQTAAVYRELV
ncbi:glycosyltransferase family 4 protein [Cupriavidus necator]|nr:glycosyltransferase family 1 protein [Cupriavidus necator]